MQHQYRLVEYSSVLTRKINDKWGITTKNDSYLLTTLRLNYVPLKLPF